MNVGCCYAMVAVGDEALCEMAHAISTIRKNDSRDVTVFALVDKASQNGVAFDFVKENAKVVDLSKYIRKVNDVFGYDLGNRLTAMYAKLFIPCMGFAVGFRRIVYLDNDVSVQSSLEGLRSMPVENGMAACRDGIGDMRRRFGWYDNPMPRPSEEELKTLEKKSLEDSPYVNSGVIVFDKEKLPVRYMGRILHAAGYAKRVGHTSAPDQDLFNMEFDFDLFGNEYNHDPHFGATKNTPVLHYFGKHHKDELKKIVQDFIVTIAKENT